MLMLRAIEIEIAFFIPLGIPRVARWIISFMLHISGKTSLTNCNLQYINELLEIFLKLSMKTVQVHLITGTTSVTELFDKVISSDWNPLIIRFLLFFF